MYQKLSMILLYSCGTWDDDEVGDGGGGGDGGNNDNDNVFIAVFLILLLFWTRGIISQCNECWNHKVNYCIKRTYYKATVSGCGNCDYCYSEGVKK